MVILTKRIRQILLFFIDDVEFQFNGIINKVLLMNFSLRIWNALLKIRFTLMNIDCSLMEGKRCNWDTSRKQFKNAGKLKPIFIKLDKCCHFVWYLCNKIFFFLKNKKFSKNYETNHRIIYRQYVHRPRPLHTSPHKR